MTNQTTAVARPDNLFGICHALGDTFGFNPLYLRLLLLVAIVADAKLALLAYAVAGIAVMVAKGVTHRWTRRSTSDHKLVRA